ncbi:MAG: hypothetical protein ACLRFG_01025 [Clostridia bacterium]
MHYRPNPSQQKQIKQDADKLLHMAVNFNKETYKPNYGDAKRKASIMNGIAGFFDAHDSSYTNAVVDEAERISLEALDRGNTTLNEAWAMIYTISLRKRWAHAGKPTITIR